jgi:hypothetical protein
VEHVVTYRVHAHVDQRGEAPSARPTLVGPSALTSVNLLRAASRSPRIRPITIRSSSYSPPFIHALYKSCDRILILQINLAPCPQGESMCIIRCRCMEVLLPSRLPQCPAYLTHAADEVKEVGQPVKHRLRGVVNEQQAVLATPAPALKLKPTPQAPATRNDLACEYCCAPGVGSPYWRPAGELSRARERTGPLGPVLVRNAVQV